MLPSVYHSFSHNSLGMEIRKEQMKRPVRTPSKILKKKKIHKGPTDQFAIFKYKFLKCTSKNLFLNMLY